MSIDLTALPIRAASPMPLDLGGTLRGALGGGQRINRMGSRWMLRVETPPMRLEPDGRQWSPLISRARKEGARVRVRQPVFVAGNPGSPTVKSAVANGRQFTVTGVTPGYVVRHGQWLSVIVGGRRYLDRQAYGDTAADANGDVILTIENLIRVPLPAGAVVELVAPVIEGTVEDVEGGDWPATRTTRWAFTVVEDE